MASRLISLMLVVVLLWSGTGTYERSGTGAPAAAEPAVVAVADDSATADFERHHLDDLPSQAQCDPVQEGAGLPAAMQAMVSPTTAHVPRAFDLIAPRSPYLEGPLRPPRAQAA